MRLKRIWLAQQAVWRSKSSGPQSLPLAAGYLKAMASSDDAVRAATDIRIFNFSGSDSTISVISSMFIPEVPEMAAFSILGWNYHLFGRVSETYRQMNPQGWVVWGGTHAANQAARVFGMYPAVDIVVNGEGELTFLELVRALLAGASKHALHGIQGISFKDQDGEIVTTQPRPRIMDLDIIPSPILTGAIPVRDASGAFPYSSALMETNRGCPYACAFCYWGGAIGQKIRAFSMERLAAEIECVARSGAELIELCDANFGILKGDEQFLELCIRARERYGRPTKISTSWAKNKGPIFYRIVRRMKETGFHTAFNLALQSLSDPVLQDMGRKNMKVNEWEDLAAWLQSEGLDLYGELIWGCPGETSRSFLEGYDRLARYVHRIAVYPHLLLPNTSYVEKKKEFGFLTWRGQDHDFELVMAHKSMSIEENREMHRFLFWARVIAEHLVLRHIWDPLWKLAGVSQSQVLLMLDRWIETRTEPVLTSLRGLRNAVVAALETSSRYIEQALQLLYGRQELDVLLERWWVETIVPLVDEDLQGLFLDLFRYDWLTRPIYGRAPEDVKQKEFSGTRYYVRENVPFAFDIPAALDAVRNGQTPDAQPRHVLLTLYYKVGFCNDMSLYHNAHNEEFFGMPRLPMVEQAEAVMVQ